MPKIKLPNTVTLAQATQKLYDVLNDESDLACVLIGASYLDASLAALLKSYFIAGSNTVESLFQPGGTLSDFSNKAKLSYGLGLIPEKTFKNLQKISEIRNRFAHNHFMLDFSDDEVVKAVNELQPPTFEGDNSPFMDTMRYPRNRFNIIVILIANRLILDAMGTNHRSKDTRS
jgi:DNA-binding MltR family transcriptional regulator